MCNRYVANLLENFCQVLVEKGWNNAFYIKMIFEASQHLKKNTFLKYISIDNTYITIEKKKLQIPLLICKWSLHKVNEFPEEKKT